MLSSHFSFHDYLSYCEQHPGAVDLSEIETHLANNCPACLQETGWIRSVLPLLKESSTLAAVSAPPHAAAKAKQIFRQRQAAGAPQGLRVQIAKLLFDSRLSLSPVGTRGTLRSAQQIYASEECYVEIDMEKLRDGKWAIVGMLLPRAGREALIVDHAEMTAGAIHFSANAPSTEFYFDQIPEGNYTLRLQQDVREVLLHDLYIGPLS